MTTVAWDGKTLAADKQAEINGIKQRVTKIRRLPNGSIVGSSGCAVVGRIYIQWLQVGGPRPDVLDGDDWCAVLEIKPDGSIWRHEKYGCLLIEEDFYACGSGSGLALAAMECGKTAAEAVVIASKFDTGTGSEVDTLTLHD
jgi:hypothetical protein